MPTSLANIRDELLPGLMVIRLEYTAIKGTWESILAEEALLRGSLAPLSVVVPLPVAVAAGAAAAVIRNPSVTRRSLFSWKA